MAEAGLIAALGTFFTGLTWHGVAIGGAAIFIVVLGLKMLREKITLFQAVGMRNGYVKEKSFLSAMDRVETLIRDKADAEDRRMTKHGEEIGDLRRAVQDLDRKVEKVQTKVDMMEQYRER